jgi:hypothetical protein
MDTMRKGNMIRMKIMPPNWARRSGPTTASSAFVNAPFADKLSRAQAGRLVAGFEAVDFGDEAIAQP